jgi:hypothetical protein
MESMMQQQQQLLEEVFQEVVNQKNQANPAMLEVAQRYIMSQSHLEGNGHINFGY